MQSGSTPMSGGSLPITGYLFQGLGGLHGEGTVMYTLAGSFEAFAGTGPPLHGRCTAGMRNGVLQSEVTADHTH